MAPDYSDIKGGIERSDFMYNATCKDKKTGETYESKSAYSYYSIFKILDTNGDGVLDDGEVQKLKEDLDKVNKDGKDIDNLSDKALKKLLDKWGLYSLLSYPKSAVSNLRSFIQDLLNHSQKNKDTVTSTTDEGTGKTTVTKTVTLQNRDFSTEMNGKVVANNKRTTNHSYTASLETVRDPSGRILSTQSLDTSNEVITTSFKYSEPDEKGNTYITSRTIEQPLYSIKLDNVKYCDDVKTFKWNENNTITTTMNYDSFGHVTTGEIVVFDKTASNNNTTISGSRVIQGFKRDYHNGGYTDTYYLTSDGNPSSTPTEYFIKVTVSGSGNNKTVTNVTSNLTSTIPENSLNYNNLNYTNVWQMNTGGNNIANGLLTQYMLSSLSENEVKN